MHWTALSKPPATLLHQIWAEVNSLGSRGYQLKIAVFGKNAPITRELSKMWNNFDNIVLLSSKRSETWPW